MPPKYPQRFEKARKAMAEADLDLLLVTNRENLIWFTGITQIECLALLIPREGDPCTVALWLDANYVREMSGLTTHAYLFPKETIGGRLVKEIRAMGFTEPRVGFERYFVDWAVYDALRQAFPERNFMGAADLYYRARAVKEEAEIALMQKAADAASAGMAAAMKAVAPGVTEIEVLAEAEYAMLKAGSWGASFRPQVVSGERALIAHPTASEKRIEPGECVVVHLSATCEGYCAKMARTAAVGEAPAAQVATHGLVLRALEAAEAALRPGATAGEVDAAARREVEKAGFGNSWLETVGYGVGLRQSEFYPVIGRGRPDVIEAGMVVDMLLPTIYRKGVGGPRITDVIRVGEDENEVLTRYPRDLARV